MKQKILYQGAEALIFLNNKDNIVKDRIKKSYRIPELDKKIRTRRTKKEAKLLEKASKIIPCAKPLALLKIGTRIHMPYIKGQKLSENLDDFDLKKQQKIMQQIGESIAKIHDFEIIHGDLTTSNMILKQDKVYFIDFGLGFHSGKIEDRAVDIHLLKQALEAKHYKNWEKLFNAFLQGYKTSKQFANTLDRLKKVESRGRYKH